MHNDSSSRLVAIIFAFFFGALAVSGASGYVSPVRSVQAYTDEPIIVIATPRLPTTIPTEVPQPTAVPTPTQAPPQPTPAPVVIVQYVPVPVAAETMPPTVPPPPIEERGETIIQIDPVYPEKGELGGRRNLNDGKANSFGSMPEAVGP